ncbi:MAG: succinate dehydrogenase, hydrophobic membrane anchor protein [Acidiferrobacterales bacterium]
MGSAGSAHRGLGEWLLQRFTAVYMAGFVVYATLHLLITPAPDYAGWKVWITGTTMRVCTTLFFGSTAAHTWIGLRSVYMDYVHALWLRLTAMALTAAGLFALVVWVLDVLWRVAA